MIKVLNQHLSGSLRIMNKSFSKLLFFLDKDDIKKTYYLIALFIFIGLIEVLGVISIMPFVAMITDPLYFGSNEFSLYIKNYLQIDDKLLTLIFGICFVFLFISCSFLNGLTIWFNTKFSAILGKKISTRLFNHYLSQSYKYFVKSDTASLSKNVIQLSASIAESIFIPALQILTRVIILLFVSILLITVNPVAFVCSVILLGSIYSLIFYKIKTKLKIYGSERLKSNDLVFKSASDCLNSIKDVKFYKSESYFSQIFSTSQGRFLDLTAKNIILSTLPRYIIEIFAFGSIFSLILFLQYQQNNLSNYLPTIAIFLLAAYRLLPSIQQIFAFSSSIRFNLPALDLIYADMNHFEKNDISFKSITQKTDISFKDVSFSYDDSDFNLTDINLSFMPKSYTAIIGKSGAGKTTIVDLLLGLYTPLSGSIILSNRLIDTNGDLKIGYVSQNIAFINDSIKNNILFGLSDNEQDVTKISNVINNAIMNDVVEESDNGIMTLIGEKGSKFSGGQLQRIGIARSLYRSPKVLIFDEATNALDIETERKLFISLRNNYPDMTVICITHRVATMQLCDRIVCVSQNSVEEVYGDQNKNENISDIVKKQNIYAQ